jgi:hypothetical protein
MLDCWILLPDNGKTELHSYITYCACVVQFTAPYYTPVIVGFEGGREPQTSQLTRSSKITYMSWSYKLLIQHKGKVKITLWLAMKTGGAEVYLYSSFNFDASWGWVAKAKPQPLVGPQVRSPPTRIRFLDGSMHSKSLYGLHYPGLGLSILLRFIQILLKEIVKNKNLLQKPKKKKSSE